MNIDMVTTLKALMAKLNADPVTQESLHKAYSLSVRLHSQLLGVIYEQEQYGAASEIPGLADELSEGTIRGDTVTLAIHEPLPPIKELTSAVQEHWAELIQTAIGKAVSENSLPYFEKAFVHIEIVTPRCTNNTRLWDTSNRAVNLIINNLKGVFFKDDNLEHMAFSVVGRWGGEGVTIIRIFPYSHWEQLMNGILEASP